MQHKHNTIQYNTIQYNTIQYNTIQYNTIQYNTIQQIKKFSLQVNPNSPSSVCPCHKSAEGGATKYTSQLNDKKRKMKVENIPRTDWGTPRAFPTLNTSDLWRSAILIKTKKKPKDSAQHKVTKGHGSKNKEAVHTAEYQQCHHQLYRNTSNSHPEHIERQNKHDCKIGLKKKRKREKKERKKEQRKGKIMNLFDLFDHDSWWMIPSYSDLAKKRKASECSSQWTHLALSWVSSFLRPLLSVRRKASCIARRSSPTRVNSVLWYDPDHVKVSAVHSTFFFLFILLRFLIIIILILLVSLFLTVVGTCFFLFLFNLFFLCVLMPLIAWVCCFSFLAVF